MAGAEYRSKHVGGKEVLTKNLNLAVRRNLGRFPEDFMFQLTAIETDSLRLQIATSKPGRGGRRYPPLTHLASVVSINRQVDPFVF